MEKKDVIELMKSSKNVSEWNQNCDRVKEECNGYPDFWYQDVIISGLMDETLGAGSSDIKIRSLFR